MTILSKLRNLETETITKIKDMPQLFDIRTSVLFKEGLEEGLEKGMEEGVEKGVEKNQLLMISNMLTKTDMSVEQISDLSEVSIEFVQHIKENLASGK